MISGLVFFINTVWSYSTSTQEINQAPKCRSRNSFFTSFPKRNTSARKRTSDKGGKWIWLVTRRCDRPREIDPEQGNLFGKFVPRVPSLPSFSKDGGGGEGGRGRDVPGNEFAWAEVFIRAKRKVKRLWWWLPISWWEVQAQSSTTFLFQDGPGRSRSSLCFKLTCYLFTSTQQLIFFLMWIALCDK